MLDGPNVDPKRRLPFAFIVGSRASQTQLDPTDKADGVKRGDHIDRFSDHQPHRQARGAPRSRLPRDRSGLLGARHRHCGVREPKIPDDVGPNERWIDVDLSSQSLVAFEGRKPVYATVVSTGRRNADPEKDHRTVEGTFHIREKHISTTMDDDGASDGTYRIEDVPWVMYFEKSFALHGASGTRASVASAATAA